MGSQDEIEVTGKVIQVLPGNKFKVQLDTTQKNEIVCHISGRMRKNKIKVILGDAVEVTMSPYDLTIGRITRRN
jgi:translation initiation factor IF-1